MPLSVTRATYHTADCTVSLPPDARQQYPFHFTHANWTGRESNTTIFQIRPVCVCRCLPLSVSSSNYIMLPTPHRAHDTT